jgi:hypothetical protein
MKIFVAILLSAVVAINGAAIDSSEVSLPVNPFIIAPEELFTDAWDYQARLKELQADINAQLTAVRTAVSSVLKSSSSATLTQIEANSNKLLEQDGPARDQIFSKDLPSTACITNLKVVLNGITEFTGFGSSNCVTAYDTSVRGALDTAYALLQKFEGSFGDVQQIVTRSFIGKNAFTQSDDIRARFNEQFSKRTSEWEKIRPDTEAFVRTLESNIAVFNTALGECFAAIQVKVAPAYSVLTSEIATCRAFDSSPDPFAMFRV